MAEDRGFLIVAIARDNPVYLECAEALIANLHDVMPDEKVALLTDVDASDSNVVTLTGTEVIPFPFPVDYDNPFANDWQVFYATPFHETIKLEADMLVPQSISHWWTMLRHRDMVLTQGCRNYRNEPASSRHYRKIFVANDLPDVYNAITYWRNSRTAKEFFTTCRTLFQAWPEVRTAIKLGTEDPGSTDLIYAIAATMVGIERVTLPPGTSYPSLIHLKGRINDLQTENWMHELVWEFGSSIFTQRSVRLNTIEQLYPVHYYRKEFAKEILEHYGYLVRSIE